MKRFKKILKSIFRFILALFIGSVLWVLLLKWVNPSLTFIMLERKYEAFVHRSAKGKGKTVKTDTKISYKWVDYENISWYLPMAMIAAEDQNFAVHHGFDIEAIEKAIEHNKKHKRVRGASTISQQVAKNIFLWSGRSWLRKGMEVYFTFMIELLWSKKRIIEVYMNVAEMGNMTFGVGAASKKFYKTSPAKLSMSQASLLAAVLPNPRKFSAQNPSAYVTGRQIWIMEQIEQLGGKEYLKDIE